MANSFQDSERYLLTSESVTEGHPDKICDQISDAVLDSIIAEDPQARVACETAVTNGVVIVMGEITTTHYTDIPHIVRSVIRDIGYTRPEYGFDYRTCGVLVSISEQSPDIALGVNHSLELKSGSSNPLDRFGAGDQGMMVGFACKETPELMPLPIALAHRLCQQLAKVRKEQVVPYLRPDGKSQVTLEYHNGTPKRIDSIVVCAQHDPDISPERLKKDVSRQVVERVIPPSMIDEATNILVNPTGRFVIGGPVSDTGFTGRKILVDTYGGLARHGGGSFSGKDPTKVDRSAAYMARYIAKNVVAAGIADRLEIQIAYAIGKAKPLSISVEGFGTARISQGEILALVERYFDLRPAAIIDTLKLARPIYRQVSSYGHFGRNDLDLPWERIDKADILRKAAGI